MKVVILCGGMGTRLREETEYRPKPMVKIGDRPILWHIMKIYAAYGHTDFVLCLGYKSEIIKEYFYNYELLNNNFRVHLGQSKIEVFSNHNEQGWTVTLVDTGQNALKGARLKRVEKYIKEDQFMLTYGDSLGDININKLLDFHKSHGRIGTVTGINPTARFGELKITGQQVTSFHEKPVNSTEYMNGGFFVFNKDIFAHLTNDDNCDFEVGPLENIAKAGELMVFKHQGFWACMDNVRDVEYMNRLWNESNVAWKVWKT